MATMSPNMTERRTITDRRTHGSITAGKQMKALEWIPMLLLAVGGLNWGLVGLFNFNLVSFLFGEMTTLTRLVYVVVGLCALYSLYLSSRISSRN